MAEIAPFDVAAEQFVDYYQTVRGFVRQEVTRRNLTGHLPGTSSMLALDFGGGDGRDSVWLADMGDRVRFFDDSADMRERAVERFREASYRSRMKIEMIAEVDELEDESLDLVLSHGVLMYELDNPQQQVSALAAKLRPGGVLSLLTKGLEAAGQTVSAAEKEQFLLTGRYTNRLGLPAQAYDFERLETMMTASGLDPQARYGVRLLYDDDRRAIDDVPEHELYDIIAREAEASRDLSRMTSAQMLHVIGKKPLVP